MVEDSKKKLIESEKRLEEIEKRLDTITSVSSDAKISMRANNNNNNNKGRLNKKVNPPAGADMYLSSDNEIDYLLKNSASNYG